MSDAASFDPKAITAIWGNVPLCIFTLRNQVDLHHILGRGYDLGIDRQIMSSPLNSIPLCAEIHKGPMRDNMFIRAFFLSQAQTYVMHAVAAGIYSLTENDEEFMQVARSWMTNRGLNYPLPNQTAA